MTLSMYQASVPVFVRALSNLAHVLKKGEAHAKSKNVAADIASRGAARLAGVEPMSFEDNETTLEQVYSRIDRAIEYIKTFKPEQIDGSEGNTIVMKTRTGETTFEGQAYLLGFVLPNVFFHCSTAYNILRVAGTEIGKTDFIGQA